RRTVDAVAHERENRVSDEHRARSAWRSVERTRASARIARRVEKCVAVAARHCRERRELPEVNAVPNRIERLLDVVVRSGCRVERALSAVGRELRDRAFAREYEV